MPEPTATPQPTAVPIPEYVPGPREATFVDGKFKVNFLYRSEPDLAQAIDVVDVESIIGPVLERIAPTLEEGVVQTINFKGADYSRPPPGGNRQPGARRLCDAPV